MNQFEELKFYAVRNREGQWFHRKGMSGAGEHWREDVEEARIYNKIGHARRQVTYFAENWPSFGVPEIVEFSVGDPLRNHSQMRMFFRIRGNEPEIRNFIGIIFFREIFRCHFQTDSQGTDTDILNHGSGRNIRCKISGITKTFD